MRKERKHSLYEIKLSIFLAQVVSNPVGRRLGGKLATTLVATISVIFSVFSPISPSLSTFLKEGVLG